MGKPNLSACLPEELKKNLTQLADELNVSMTDLLIHSVKEVLRAPHVFLDRKRRNPDLRDHLIVAMRKEGMSYAQIGREVGLSARMIMLICRRNAVGMGNGMAKE